MLLFAQLVVGGMTTFFAYQFGHWYGFQQSTEENLAYIKKHHRSIR